MSQDTPTCSNNGCEARTTALGLCKTHYMRVYTRRRYRERRAAFIEERGSKCASCGSAGPFEIDHIDPSTKSMHVGVAFGCSEARMRAELDKCQLLCADCHHAKTRREQLADHGSDAWYKRGCRCEPCRTHYNAKTRAYRARRRVAGIPVT